MYTIKVIITIVFALLLVVEGVAFLADPEDRLQATRVSVALLWVSFALGNL